MADDLFDDMDDDWLDEITGHRDALAKSVLSLAEEREIPDELLAAMLVELAIAAQSTGYCTSTEKPSVAGLRLELDRFRRSMDDLIRHAKKGADETVAEMRAALLAAQDEAEK